MIVSSTASSIPQDYNAGRTAQQPSRDSVFRRAVDASQIRSLSDLVKDNPGMVRKATQEESDAMARVWLMAQIVRDGGLLNGPPDNLPENVYAQVRVEGKIAATLYNSGASEMSNEAAALVGKLNDPGLVGPDLAKWRAEAYAKALGGTVEMAATAKSQSEWQPRTYERPSFSRAELDRALEAIRQAAEQRHAATNRAALDVSA